MGLSEVSELKLFPLYWIVDDEARCTLDLWRMAVEDFFQHLHVRVLGEKAGSGLVKKNQIKSGSKFG